MKLIRYYEDILSFDLGINIRLLSYGYIEAEDLDPQLKTDQTYGVKYFRVTLLEFLNSFAFDK
ncbi:hypothetical protein LEP1GSC194_0327 [Leptospira alstonii serovar Sichuan str. 79601]|uniref:Uncharacterized protein n=1 Tax=Leptospira alstonii serovar Sichuan str. 79601 TaxID=1218565 RepID=M6CWJ6_9LEPT|nr:hypothetical protein LEP1GSC194_0327 [Leptospira alstonii serovar Sichuan str. 79601]